MLHIEKEVVQFINTDKEFPESTITNFVSGKRVAVVGGSPKIIGTELGETIDSYDVVVRINVHWPCPRRLFNGNGKILPRASFIRHIGNRTDILFHNGCNIGGTLKDVQKLQGLKHVVLLGATHRKSICDPIQNWCKEQSIPLLWFDHYYNHLRYHRALGGMLAIKSLLDDGVDELFMAGFDFYQEEPKYKTVLVSHLIHNDVKFFKKYILADKRTIMADHVRY